MPEMMQDEPLLQDEAELESEVLGSQESQDTEPSGILVILPLLLFIFLFGLANTMACSTYSQYVFHRFKNESTGANVTCYLTPPNAPSHFEDMAQKESSYVITKAQVALGLPAIILVILYGSFSDRCGRIPTLVLPWFGSLALLVCTCIHVALDTGFWLYFLGCALFGIGGSFVTYLTATFATVADLTTVYQRSFAITVVEAVLGSSLIFGNLITGYVIQAVKYKIPIYVSTGIFGVSSILFCFFREPRVTKERVRNSLALHPTLGSQLRGFLTHVWEILAFDRNRSIYILLLLFSLFFQVVCYIGNFNIIILYLLSGPFCFSSAQIGIYSAVTSACVQIGCTSTVWMLRDRVNDFFLAVVGLLSYATSNILIGLSSQFSFPTNLIFLTIAAITGLLTNLTVAMIRSMLSKLVHSDSQGVIFALVASMETTAALCGGLLLNSVFAASLTFLHGFVYFFMAALNLLSIVLLLCASRWHRRSMSVPILVNQPL